MQLRAEKKAALQHDEKNLKAICEAAFSDTFSAWIHLKAMLTFVEAVLRFGLPPNFAAFLLKPKAKSLPALRTALADIFCKTQTPSSYATSKVAEADAEGEEWYPYVSLSFSPLVVARTAA